MVAHNSGLDDSDSVIIAKLLLDKDIDPGSNDEILNGAVGNDKLELVKLLLTYPTVNPIDSLEHSNSYKMTMLLLFDLRTDPSANNNKALKRAIRGIKLKTFQALIKDSRVDPSLKNNKLIRLAYDSHRKIRTSKGKKGRTISTKQASANNRKQDKLAAIIGILLNDKKVLKSLSEDDIIKYSSVLGG